MRWVRLQAYQIKLNQKLVLGVGGNHKYLGKIFSDQHTGQTNSTYKMDSSSEQSSGTSWREMSSFTSQHCADVLKLYSITEPMRNKRCTLNSTVVHSTDRRGDSSIANNYLKKLFSGFHTLYLQDNDIVKGNICL